MNRHPSLLGVFVGAVRKQLEKVQEFSQASKSTFYNSNPHVTLEFKKARKDVSIVSDFPVFLLPSLNVPEYFLRYKSPVHDVKSFNRWKENWITDCSHE